MLHQYKLTTIWTGNTGQGTSSYRLYERSHIIRINNKVDIACSSDAAFIGDTTKYNPEELFLASLSACHMLQYLHLCASNGVVVLAYTDEATATMAESTDGGGKFTEAVLFPRVIVANASMIAKADDLHKEANRLCFIANSVNFPVRHIPVCNTELF